MASSVVILSSSDVSAPHLEPMPDHLPLPSPTSTWAPQNRWLQWPHLAGLPASPPHYKRQPQPLPSPPLLIPLAITLFLAHRLLLDEARHLLLVKAIARLRLPRRYPILPPVSTLLTPTTSPWSLMPHGRATTRPWCTVAISSWWTKATISPRATDPVDGNFQTKTILNSWKSHATF
jgi:hypothetical protein